MKKILLLLILLFGKNAYSQPDGYDELYQNTVTWEFLGHSQALMSVNYERLFEPINKYFTITARTGVGFTPGYGDDESNGKKYNYQTAVPFVVTTLFGKHLHYAQFGAAYTSIFTRGLVDNTSHKTYKRYRGIYSLSLGYRFVYYEQAVVQLYPMLTFPDEPDKKVALGVGFSVGIAF